MMHYIHYLARCVHVAAQLYSMGAPQLDETADIVTIPAVKGDFYRLARQGTYVAVFMPTDSPNGRARLAWDGYL